MQVADSAEGRIQLHAPSQHAALLRIDAWLSSGVLSAMHTTQHQESFLRSSVKVTAGACQPAEASAEGPKGHDALCILPVGHCEAALLPGQKGMERLRGRTSGGPPLPAAGPLPGLSAEGPQGTAEQPLLPCPAGAQVAAHHCCKVLTSFEGLLLLQPGPEWCQDSISCRVH